MQKLWAASSYALGQGANWLGQSFKVAAQQVGQKLPMFREWPKRILKMVAQRRGAKQCDWGHLMGGHDGMHLAAIGDDGFGGLVDIRWAEVMLMWALSGYHLGHLGPSYFPGSSRGALPTAMEPPR